MLNRDAPYVQIIEHFRQEIREGRLKDGDMLPSGREIAGQFGVSLATAAKVATAPQAVAAQLCVEPLTVVVRRRQATIRDGVTAAMLTSWFPVSVAERVPELLKRARL